MRPSFQILAALLILAGAGFGFWTGISGILEGAVTFPSKRETYHVLQEASPKTFWASVLVWLAMGLGFTWLAVVNLREAFRRA